MSTELCRSEVSGVHGEAEDSEDARSDSDPLVDVADLNQDQNKGGRPPRRGRGRPRGGGRGRGQKRTAASHDADVAFSSRGRGRGRGSRGGRGRGSGRCRSSRSGAAAPTNHPGAEFLRTQLKRARHHSPGEQPAESSSTTLGGSSASGAPRRGRPAAHSGKTLCVSITAVIPGADIPMAVFNSIAAYIKHHTHSGSVSTERGGAFQQLHVQGVLKQRSTSSRKIKAVLLQYLQQHVQNFSELGVQMCCKQAANKGLHTWEGLVGYSRKYQGRDDYHNVLHNVSVFDIEEGEKLLRLHGSAIKHRVALTQHNIMERAAAFQEFELRGRFEVSLPAVVWAMLTSGQYFLDPTWAVPAQGTGMAAERADVVWRSCIAPSSITRSDTDVALFRLSWDNRTLGARGLVPPGVRAGQQDDTLEQIVLEAQRTGSKVGEVVDTHPAFRALLFGRATDVVLQRQPERGLRLQADEQQQLQQLREGEQMRWHADLLHHEQQGPGNSSDSKGATAAAPVAGANAGGVQCATAAAMSTDTVGADAAGVGPSGADAHDVHGAAVSLQMLSAGTAHGGDVGQLHADDFSALYNTEHTRLRASQHESVLQRVQREKAQRRRERQLMEEDAAPGGCW